MKSYGFTFFLTLCGYFVCDIAAVSAQTEAESAPISQTMEVTRIGVADLNGILRAADANARVRELLDAQRQKFQDELATHWPVSFDNLLVQCPLVQPHHLR